ncbi:MAG: Lrp/AsnC ligand binding domain-containing protein [Nitrospirae bacterium]|nr:Lrp/AsnC ligand binding domain-containing protein [Nitrospirota bacterium]MDA1303960.1 Lrp/AsnC ligand binding domain-containing protein [Nitrospirota bacterium]
MAISAFVMVDVIGDHTKSACKTITRIPGVKHVYGITGPYDIIVDIEAESLEELNDLVLSRMRSVDGVRKTTTAIVLNVLNV